VKSLNTENLVALEIGVANLERHVRNVREHYGLPCVVSINNFTFDTPAELQLLQDRMAKHEVPVLVARHWAEGGKGAEDVARAVVDIVENGQPGAPGFQFVYEESLPLLDKITSIATKIYGAAGVSADDKVRGQLRKLEAAGYAHYPVCVAKTQYSFSTDAGARGAPSGHTLNIREVRLAAGAEFIVMVCGDVMTMPGLPKVPSAEKIDVDDSGNIVGLF
jgi:formate--tetrahydrofolate ligase